MKEWEDLELSLLFKELVIVREEAKQEKSPSPALMVLCHETDKANLNAETANLKKITTALGIEHIHTLMSPVEAAIEAQNIGPETTVWGIGLSTEIQELIRATGAKQVLFSANPENLKTVEDKRKMFEPLKEFSTLLKAF